MFKKIIAIWICSSSLLLSCGGSFWPEDYQFNFLHKRDFVFSNIDGNLNYSAVYNDIVYQADKKAKEINLKEWEKEFGDKYSLTQIKDYLYENKGLDTLDAGELLDYITFLNKQSPYVNSWREYYFEIKRIKRENVDGLIAEALSRIKTTKSKYLKVRYFFLGLRLAHYYNKGNPYEIYMDNKSLLIGNDSIVNDWIQGLYAGILVKKGKRVQGVYEFTKLFDESKTNWYLAYYNFKEIKTNQDWNKLVSMAKNKEEETKFITLRALDPKSNILEELKNIAAIDIDSKYFDLLLFRELVKSQSFFDNYPPFLGARTKVDYKDMIEYLKTVSKTNMYMINLSLAYFSFYDNDIGTSKKYLQKAYKTVKGDDIHELKALEYILYLNELKTINADTENNIAMKLDELSTQKCNNDSILKYTFYKVKDLYKKQGDEFKYFISAHYNYLGIENITLPLYENIQTLKIKKDKSGLEKYMLEKIIFKNEGFSRDLRAARIKMLMGKLKFQQILDEYPNELNQKLKFNIFNNLISGNNRRITSSKLTLKETLEKIVEVEKNLKANPNDAINNYLYATVIYNLSFWGNSYSLGSVLASSFSLTHKEIEENKINLSTLYLNKAYDNAVEKEFKAKIKYMLAKNEIAMYDLNNVQEYNEVDKRYTIPRNFWGDESTEKYILAGYGKNFDILKSEFSDTDYYKEIIHQCADLKTYQNNLKKINDDKEISLSLSSFERKLSEFYKNKMYRNVREYDFVFFGKLFIKEPITKKTVESYNNIAYYLEKMNQNEYAIIILNKILQKYPDRVVAYYNLGDAYWYIPQKTKAKMAYAKYIELMTKNAKENKIPQKVKDRMKTE